MKATPFCSVPLRPNDYRLNIFLFGELATTKPDRKVIHQVLIFANRAYGGFRTIWCGNAQSCGPTVLLGAKILDDVTSAKPVGEYYQGINSQMFSGAMVPPL